MDPVPGTYILELRNQRPCFIDVGRLGRTHCPAGWYLYVGSAHGPGGLRARVQRHLRADKTRRWHIDHIRVSMTLSRVWYSADRRRLECHWSRALNRLGGEQVRKGLGASDCRCPTHLYYFPRRPDLDAFQRVAGAEITTAGGG